MNNFSANYAKILETIQQIEHKMNFLHQIRKPKLSDIELIAVDLTSEYMSIDSEYQLFRVLPFYLKAKIERSVYNRRKRRLFYYREQLRKKLTGHYCLNALQVLHYLKIIIYLCGQFIL